MPVYQLIARKFVRDLLNAPVKVRAELICGQRSYFRDVLERAGEQDESDCVWTDELEEAYKAIAERYGLNDDPDAADEDGRSRSAGEDRDRDRDQR